MHLLTAEVMFASSMSTMSMGRNNTNHSNYAPKFADKVARLRVPDQRFSNQST